MNDRNVDKSKRRNRDDVKSLFSAGANDHVDGSTFGRLDVSTSPDMTRRIMGRLGYMRVAPTVARRHRIRTWMNRCGVMMIACVALAMAWRVYEGSEAVRHESDLTIPAAISNDVQHHQQRLGNVIRTFRQMTSPAVATPVAPVPTQLNPAHPHPARPHSESEIPANPQPLDSDIVEPSHSSFRWV